MTSTVSKLKQLGASTNSFVLPGASDRENQDRQPNSTPPSTGCPTTSSRFAISVKGVRSASAIAGSASVVRPVRAGAAKTVRGSAPDDDEAKTARSSYD